MGDIVIDEWLWADLAGHNNGGIDKQQQAFAFLQAIYNKCDRIIIVRNSAFEKKTWRLCKSDDVFVQSIARYFTTTFIRNSDKTRFTDLDESNALAAEIEATVKPPDRYLVHALQTSGVELLITSDGPLLKALVGHGLRCVLRDDFVAPYIAQYG